MTITVAQTVNNANIYHNTCLFLAIAFVGYIECIADSIFINHLNNMIFAKTVMDYKAYQFQPDSARQPFRNTTPHQKCLDQYHETKFLFIYTQSYLNIHIKSVLLTFNSEPTIWLVQVFLWKPLLQQEYTYFLYIEKAIYCFAKRGWHQQSFRN